jgi:DNA phosphorothioation-dependent restriction protein DptG
MRTPSIKSIVICFLIGVFISCNQYDTKEQQETKGLTKVEQYCIQQVIDLDDSLGTIRNHACETISLSETIDQYAAAMDKINYKDCPEKFTEAFAKHREAWKAMKDVTDNYPELRGEMHTLFDQIEKGKDSSLFKPRLKNIWDTWGAVEPFISKK